jgi:Polyketide cyclase / dehydrase and lipid transport
MKNNSTDHKILWPEEFRPEKSPIFVSNKLTMNVAPELAWAWLIRATRWPEWYPNSANVRYENESSTDLQMGTRFRWKTFGLNLQSEVVEYSPAERLAWNARGVGVWAYHAWLIRPVDGGCVVLTEETQHGLLARLGKLLFPQRIVRLHQLWLEELQRKGQTGRP